MGKWGSVDFSGLKQLQKQLEKAAQDNKAMMYEIAETIGNEFLTGVINRTPATENNQLKAHWKKRIVPASNGFNIIVENDLEYASFVEYGKRIGNNGWQQGRFMLHITEQDIQNRLNGIITPIVEKRLKEIFK